MALEELWPSRRDVKGEVIVAYGDELRNLVSYLKELPESEWAGPTLCPDWDVKGVVSHLVGQAEDFLDKRKTKVIRKAAKAGTDVILPIMIEANQRHYESGRRYTPSELLGLLQDLRGRMAIRLSQIPSFAWGIKIKGVMPMRMFQAMSGFVFESWVHRMDVQRPRGHANGDAPWEILLPHTMFGVAKQRNYEPVVSVNVDLGDAGVYHLATDGVGFVKGFTQDAKTTVRLNPADFVLLGAGRVDGDDVDVEIEGERGPGMELLYSARFTGLVPGL